MTMPIDLWIVRHGQSEGNAANRRRERGDHAEMEKLKGRHTAHFRLTEKGVEQAKMAGAWLRKNAPNGFDKHYVSGYLRAIETAARLEIAGAQWYVEPYLRERDDIELAPKNDRITNRASYWGEVTSPESIAQLCLRIDRVLDTLHRECAGLRVIIVAHGDVMRAFRVRLERMPEWRFYELLFSKNPKDRLHNGQVLHYSRRNPETGRISPHINWMRSVCTTDPSLSTNEWEKIERKKYSNEELLEIAEKTPRIIEG